MSGYARFLVGDVFDRIAELEDDSVDLVFTSPPFLALRSYLPSDHPDKAHEIGAEATPADYLDSLLDVVEACDRVLAPHGSLCVELGDTYAGSGGSGGDYAEGGFREGQPAFRGSGGRRSGSYGRRGVGEGSRRRDTSPETYKIDPAVEDRQRGKQARPEGTSGDGWPEPKCLTGIPDLFQNSLAYGRNLLRPERETPRWRVRNKHAWCRPNPPVGQLADKWRPATSYVTAATKSAQRWFDLEAVRRPYMPRRESRGSSMGNGRTSYDAESERMIRRSDRDAGGDYRDGPGAPPNDYMILPTSPYQGSHYATFPTELVTPFVRSMCPLQVCRVCGEPRRRIVEKSGDQGEWRETDDRQGWTDEEHGNRLKTPSGPSGFVAQYDTVGWTECEHGDYRSGVVLDPFAGTGTTLMVATGEGRDAVGIDLDPRNVDLALERCGMFLTVEGVA